MEEERGERWKGEGKEGTGVGGNRRGKRRVLEEGKQTRKRREGGTEERTKREEKDERWKSS